MQGTEDVTKLLRVSAGRLNVAWVHGRSYDDKHPELGKSRLILTGRGEIRNARAWGNTVPGTPRD